jgi:hypothetical protein
MKTIIRRAIKDDCLRLLELVQELATYERAPGEVTVTLDHFAESGFGKQPVWWAFVAEVDERIVGFALYYIRYSTGRARQCILKTFSLQMKCGEKALANCYLTN